MATGAGALQHRRGRGARSMSRDGVKVSRQQDCSSWKVIGWWDAEARSRMRIASAGTFDVLEVDDEGRVGMIEELGRSGDVFVLIRVRYRVYIKC